MIYDEMTSEIKSRAPSTRKQHILEQAARLFRDKGYKATSMRDIALSVGIEPSSLYSHINSKEELLKSICFSCGDTFIRGIREIAAKEQSAADKVCALIRLHVRIAFDDVTATTVFNDEWRHLSEPDLSAFIAMRKSYEQACLAIIREGMRAGTLVEMDEQVVLHTLISAMQWLYRSRMVPPGNTLEITEQITALLMRGMETR